MSNHIANKELPGCRLHMPANVMFHDDGSIEFVQADENVWLSAQQFAGATLFWREQLLKQFPLLRHLVSQ